MFCNVVLPYCVNILDSARIEKVIDFTMMYYFFCKKTFKPEAVW